MALPPERDAHPAGATPPHRQEIGRERRHGHPGDPRRTVVSDRPEPRRDRRGAHGIAPKDPKRR